jgi:hypothetical protein
MRPKVKIATALAGAAVVALGTAATAAQAAVLPASKIVSTYSADVRAKTISADCPTGYQATGGSSWVADNRISVSGSWPEANAVGVPVRWKAEFGRFDFPVRGYVYVVCNLL